MNVYLRPLTLSMISPDADYMHPCFRLEDVERALDRMTKKLGFQRVEKFKVPAVFTFEYDDLRLTVMTTPRVFHSDRLCYAFSGVLVRSDGWSTEIAALGHIENNKISTWRNHPREFFQDLLDAVENLRPDMWLPGKEQKLLGPAVVDAVEPQVRRLTCIEWFD